MSEQHPLNYESVPIRAGHSRFGIASVSVAIAVFIFTGLAMLGDSRGFDLFDSIGNDKQVRIGTVAAVLGILLASRALQDRTRRQFLGILGLVLNSLALVAVSIFLPTL